MTNGANPAERRRKLRLMQMVEVARVYRSCSKNELAAALDRDPAKIVPDSGNPKLDLVFSLANVLNWSVADVADAIWGRPGPVVAPTASFDELNEASITAHRAGDYEAMLSLGRQMSAVARTPRERASAAWRLAGGFEGLGMYVRALEWMQVATREHELPSESLRVLRSNLAACHYALGNLVEAIGVASTVLAELEEVNCSDRRDRSAQALALHVQGNSLRRVISIDPGRAVDRAAKARGPLARAVELFGAMAADFGDISYAGVANTCRGALLEVDVELGALAATDAIAQIISGLAALTEVESHPKGDMLESWGWWAIFGCNIAQRHLSGEERERALAVLSNKAAEIADRQGNWSLREQVFSLEFVERMRNGSEASAQGSPWILDAEDLRNLVGTMGRFPHFRETGWEILSKAHVVGMTGVNP